MMSSVGGHAGQKDQSTRCLKLPVRVVLRQGLVIIRVQRGRRARERGLRGSVFRRDGLILLLGAVFVKACADLVEVLKVGSSRRKVSILSA